MRSKERVKKAFHFNKPDKIPVAYLSFKSDFFPMPPMEPKSWQPTNFPPHVLGGVEAIANRGFRAIIYNWKKEHRIKAEYPKDWWNYPHKSIDEWGNIWDNLGAKSRDISKGHPHIGFLHHSWDKLEEFQIPDASNQERYRLIRNRAWRFIGRKRYSVGELGANGFFNLCSQIRGFNNLLIDFARNETNVKKLVGIILPFYLTQIEKMKENCPELDSIFVADDMGTQKSPFISPKIFRNIFKDPYKKIINLTHDLEMDFILHSCGQIFELMQDISEAGVDVFQFDSPHMAGVENFKYLANERKIAFWLSSNIQTTYVNGTPEDIENEIKYYIQEVGNNEGGLAISEYGSNRALRTPKVNIIAQRQAVEKWGNYDQDGVIEWLA